MIVAALGMRVLELFVDPAVFGSLPHVQQRLFRTTDVLLTGAVLGGGSDALHQLVRNGFVSQNQDATTVVDRPLRFARRAEVYGALR